MFWAKLSGVVSMAQSAVVTKPPSVEVTVGNDGCTMGSTASDVSHTFGAQSFNQTGFITIPAKEGKQNGQSGSK